MAKKTILKNISFDNLDEFAETVKALQERKGVKNVNFGGNITKDEKSGETILRINLNWEEEETF